MAGRIVEDIREESTLYLGFIGRIRAYNSEMGSHWEFKQKSDEMYLHFLKDRFGHYIEN